MPNRYVENIFTDLKCICGIRSFNSQDKESKLGIKCTFGQFDKSQLWSLLRMTTLYVLLIPPKITDT